MPFLVRAHLNAGLCPVVVTLLLISDQPLWCLEGELFVAIVVKSTVVFGGLLIWGERRN